MNKTIEITGYKFNDGDLYIYANDVSEENLQRIERNRIDEDFTREIQFCIGFTDEKFKKYNWKFLNNWLKNQKVIRDASEKPATFGEALSLIVGTVTDLPMKYYVPSY